MYVHCAHRPKEGTGSPGTGGTDSCESPCSCWKSNPGPLQDQGLLNSEPPPAPTLKSGLSQIQQAMGSTSPRDHVVSAAPSTGVTDAYHHVSA